MTAAPQIERRHVQHPPLVLEHSFLFRIPPRYAWPLVLSLLASVAVIERISPREIWFGPIYLAVVSLAAWALSTRTAIALGLVTLVLKLSAGTLTFYPAGPGLALGNLAVRAVGIAIVVGFIGLARKSCEREWRLARTDLLTGTLNRQAFFELVRSGRCAGGWSALIYCDLDGLKQLNDRQGHDRGDDSLRAFVETVRRTIRKGDVLARMGGDEFVIFMKLRDEEAGAAVARRLHQAINTSETEGPVRLKCSLGVLVLPQGSRSIDDELRAADELMYKAKHVRSGVAVATAREAGGHLSLFPGPPLAAPCEEHEPRVRQTDRTPEPSPRIAA